VPDPKPDVVADDRSSRGGDDDPDDVEPMGRAGVQRRGDEHGLAGKGDAQAFDADEPKHGRIAELAEEPVDEAGGKKHER
jgi:hypothetical protein